jgi:hypothetical protein
MLKSGSHFWGATFSTAESVGVQASACSASSSELGQRDFCFVGRVLTHWALLIGAFFDRLRVLRASVVDKFGNWNLFGAWLLELGDSSHPLPTAFTLIPQNANRRRTIPD